MTFGRNQGLSVFYRTYVSSIISRAGNLMSSVLGCRSHSCDYASYAFVTYCPLKCVWEEVKRGGQKKSEKKTEVKKGIK